MVRWFGCLGKSHDRDPSKSKSKTKKGASVNGGTDAETAALNNHHDTADGELLREKVSVIEHPSNGVTQRESSACKLCLLL